jgi:hypothetical protein
MDTCKYGFQWIPVGIDFNGYLQIWISMDTCKYGFQWIPLGVEYNGYL